MNGIICGIKRMEIHDGDGLRTTVFFKGCPLRCVWCHNPESLSFEPETAKFAAKCILCGVCRGQRSAEAAELCPAGALVHYGEQYTAAKLCERICRDEVFFKNSGGGVTLSGGECLAQIDFAAEVARILHERGISVYVDTCGFVSRAALDKIMPYTDKFLYDIKAVDPDVHKRCTGRDNAPILENLCYLVERGCRIEIRFPLVVGYNDGECERIGELLARLGGIERVKVLQYHNLSGSRYEALGMENTLPDSVTERHDVERAVEILRSHGLCAVNGMDEN